MNEVINFFPAAAVVAFIVVGAHLMGAFARRQPRPLVAVAHVSPLLRIHELSLYAGPHSTACSELSAHGLPPKRVDAIFVYRSARPGLPGAYALPPAVLHLLRGLASGGLVRGAEISALLYGGALPAGKCLWFAQVGQTPGSADAQIVAFSGPDKGVSDFA